MAEKRKDIYVDKDGKEISQTDWNPNTFKPEYYMEGFFDYKERLINPASENLKLTRTQSKNFINHIFTLINRDLQLGNLTQFQYALVYQHFHLGVELMRFGLYNAGMQFLQKGYTLLVMSNSRGGFQRKLEATNIGIRKLQSDKGAKDDWWKIKSRKKEK